MDIILTDVDKQNKELKLISNDLEGQGKTVFLRICNMNEIDTKGNPNYTYFIILRA